jgi:hypothetical protein
MQESGALQNSISSIRQRLEHRFSSYWFQPGFALSHAICRIALGCALLAMIQALWQPDFHAYLEVVNKDTYHPLGLCKLFGHSVPGPAFLWGCQWVAYVTSWLVIIGFLTRVSFVVCLASSTILSTLPWCFYGGWCHHQNVILLAGLAMMFGPPSLLSADAMIHSFWLRFRSGKDNRPGDGHCWPVLLGQFAVAFMFANAAFWKLFHPDLPFLAWARSDNLRNQLLYQYWVLRKPLPGFLEDLLSWEWGHIILAVGNLVTQLTPCLACFLVRRPLLRALAGSAVVLETFALGKVMGLHNPIWYLLFAFFIDWDRLAGVAMKILRLGNRISLKTATFVATPVARGWRTRFACIWIVLFVSFYLMVAFTHKTQHRYTYPFTAFPMYSTVFAEPPYAEHRPWTLLASTWDIDADPPLPQNVQDNFIWCNYYLLPWKQWQACCESLKAITMHLEHHYHTRIRRLKLETTTFQIQAFPSKEINACQSAVKCIYKDHQFIGLDTWPGLDKKNGKYYLDIVAHGFANPSYRIGYYLRGVGEWQPLEVECHGHRYYYHKKCREPYFLTVKVRDATLGDQEITFGGAYVE